MDHEDWQPVPLMRDKEIIEAPVDQMTLTPRYTEESLEFKRAYREQPFFLCLAHTFPDVPLYASDNFRGTSSRGFYGDVIEEIDPSERFNIADEHPEVLSEIGELVRQHEEDLI